MVEPKFKIGDIVEFVYQVIPGIEGFPLQRMLCNVICRIERINCVLYDLQRIALDGQIFRNIREEDCSLLDVCYMDYFKDHIKSINDAYKNFHDWWNSVQDNKFSGQPIINAKQKVYVIIKNYNEMSKVEKITADVDKVIEFLNQNMKLTLNIYPNIINEWELNSSEDFDSEEYSVEIHYIE